MYSVVFETDWIWFIVKLWICFMVIAGWLAWTFWLSRTRHKK